MGQKGLTLTQQRIIDKLSTLLLTEEERLNLADLIRMLRNRFHMTQRQLAKRAGVPQSYISKVESGELEPSMKSLKKLFNVLYCDAVVVPIARDSFDEVIEKQARKLARKNLEYVKGMMSLEKQLPTEEFLKDLLEEEVKRLVYSGTTKIWDI